MNTLDTTTSLTRDVLELAAPEELFLLDTYVRGEDNSGRTSRGPQGFGGEMAIIMLTPFLFKFFDTFLNRIATRAADGSWEVLRKWFFEEKTAPGDDVITMIEAEMSRLELPKESRDALSSAITLTLSNRRGTLDHMRTAR